MKNDKKMKMKSKIQELPQFLHKIIYIFLSEMFIFSIFHNISSLIDQPTKLSLKLESFCIPV